jgi:histone H3/H4
MTDINENQINTPIGPVKKKRPRYFETYIAKILKTVSSTNGIASNAKQQLNSAIKILAKIIAEKCHNITQITKKKTMSTKEVEASLSVVLSGQLLQQTIEYSKQSVESFMSGDVNKGTSRQSKANIIFPPSTSEKFLRDFGYSKIMVTSSAPVYLASALEFITTLILTKASDTAKLSKHVRINIRDLEMAMRNNEDLSKVFNDNNITFLGGGSVPYIHPVLRVKKPKRKKVVKIDPQEGVDTGKKPHRFRPGTVSLREIKKFQKMSNCLTLAKFPFEKFVRDIVLSLTVSSETTMKISKDVFTVLQYFIEQQIVDILRNSNLAAIHANRVKLMPNDINFIMNLRNGNSKQSFTDLDIDANTIDDDIEEELEDELSDSDTVAETQPTETNVVEVDVKVENVTKSKKSKKTKDVEPVPEPVPVTVTEPETVTVTVTEPVVDKSSSKGKGKKKPKKTKN